MNLAGKAFAPSAARCKPLFKPSRLKESEQDAPTKDAGQEKTEETAAGKDKGNDLLICGFCARGADCILRVRVTDADAKSCSERDPAKVPDPQEKEKK